MYKKKVVPTGLCCLSFQSELKWFVLRMCVFTVLVTVTRTSCQCFITRSEIPRETGSAVFYGTIFDVEPERVCVKITSTSFDFNVLEKLFLFAMYTNLVFNSPFVIPAGCMQDGTVLGDVQLPPWADGDPHKFILLHRQVSEYQDLGVNAELGSTENETLKARVTNQNVRSKCILPLQSSCWVLNFVCLLVCLTIHLESRQTR